MSTVNSSRMRHVCDDSRVVPPTSVPIRRLYQEREDGSLRVGTDVNRGPSVIFYSHGPGVGGSLRLN